MARQMKDSGIEWIGEIPAGWRTCKIKDIFQVVSGATPKSEQPEYWDGDIIWVTPADYKTNDKYVSFGKRTITQAGYDSCGTTLVPAGSIVFSKRAPIGSVAIAQAPLCTNQGCLSCINKGDVDTTFFYYVMSIFTEIFELYGSGTTFKELSYDSFAAFTMTNPPLDEQHLIADFLDRKCAEIDAVIERTKTTIEEYKKLKQAVITEAVTKGVRGPRPMKDSGIEWIGEIPEEWSVGSIKYGVTKVGSGKTPLGGADSYADEGILFLRSQNVYDTGLLLDSPTYITSDVDEEMSNTRVYPGDVLLNITGGSIGRCCIFPEEQKRANVNQHVCIIRVITNVFTPEYMHYYWISALGHTVIDMYQTGGNREGMSADAIKNAPIIYMSLAEQAEITAYLDEKCAALDTLITKKTALLTELETYKKSLIYEYVTGKKEVQ